MARSGRLNCEHRDLQHRQASASLGCSRQRLLTTHIGGNEMRQCWSVMRSRAGFVFGGATLTLLLLPVTASAISVMVPGTRDVHRNGTAQAAATSPSALDFVLFFGVVAAVLLLIFVVSRLEVGKALKAGSARRTAAG